MSAKEMNDYFTNQAIALPSLKITLDIDTDMQRFLHSPLSTMTPFVKYLTKIRNFSLDKAKEWISWSCITVYLRIFSLAIIHTSSSQPAYYMVLDIRY